MRAPRQHGGDGPGAVAAHAAIQVRTGPACHADTSPRLARAAEHLHALGPRALAELLADLAAPEGPDALLARLAPWLRLHPATLRAVQARYARGRHFAPDLFEVPR